MALSTRNTWRSAHGTTPASRATVDPDNASAADRTAGQRPGQAHAAIVLQNVSGYARVGELCLQAPAGTPQERQCSRRLYGAWCRRRHVVGRYFRQTERGGKGPGRPLPLATAGRRGWWRGCVLLCVARRGAGGQVETRPKAARAQPPRGRLWHSCFLRPAPIQHGTVVVDAWRALKYFRCADPRIFVRTVADNETLELSSGGRSEEHGAAGGRGVDGRCLHAVYFRGYGARRAGLEGKFKKSDMLKGGCWAQPPATWDNRKKTSDVAANAKWGGQGRPASCGWTTTRCSCG